MKRALLFFAVAFASLLPYDAARAWWAGAHVETAKSAARAPSEQLPAFFREGEGLIAHASIDPDVIRGRDAPALRDAERPEHFIDLELLKGRKLPPTRYAYYRLCQELGINPAITGTLPYAIIEWTQRLAFAFEEHRRYPDSPYIRFKTLYIAGILSHYAADLCNPLHCTVHYDGRANPDGSSPHTGIHAKVDGLPEKLELTADDFALTEPVEPYEDLLKGIMEEIHASRELIDFVYDNEEKLPREFAVERMRAAARFTARLYETAWSYPFKNGLPSWLDQSRSIDPPFNMEKEPDVKK